MIRTLIFVSVLALSACSQPGPETPLSDPSAATPTTAPGKSLADVATTAPKDAMRDGDLALGTDDGRTPAPTVFGQPADERAAQQNLPKSNDAQWAVLATTKIGEDLERGAFTATHPRAVRALAGKTMTISGYVMPLDATPTFTRFLLTRYTPVCQFCPPGMPNEVIEVQAAAPIAPTQALIRVRGRFSLHDNGEQGLFFRIDGATVEPGGA